jgi:hypothetical protein
MECRGAVPESLDGRELGRAELVAEVVGQVALGQGFRPADGGGVAAGDGRGAAPVESVE